MRYTEAELNAVRTDVTTAVDVLNNLRRLGWQPPDRPAAWVNVRDAIGREPHASGGSTLNRLDVSFGLMSCSLTGYSLGCKRLFTETVSCASGEEGRYARWNLETSTLEIKVRA